MAATGFLFGDTFDYYATADVTRKWTSFTKGLGSGLSTLNITASAARNGAQGARIHPEGLRGSLTECEATLRRTLSPGDPTTFVQGFAFRADIPFIDSIGIAACQDHGSVQCQLVLNSDGTLSVARSSSRSFATGKPLTNVLGTTSAAILYGSTFFHIKWKVVISDSVGTVDVWINGINVLSLTGKDTKATSNTSWNESVLGQIFVPQVGTAGMNNNSNSVNWDYDDFTTWDANYTGYDLIGQACHAEAGNGANTDFTPSTGSDHGALVDEATDADDDSTYNSSSVVGDIDTYTIEDVPTTAIIRAVQSVDVTRKTDPGDRTIANVFRIGGIDYVGSDLAPSETYFHLLTPYSLSPATGVEFTAAEFNAMEAGEKITS